MIFNDDKLKNSVKTKQLKTEAFDKTEFDGLLRSAKARLIDSQKPDLSFDSRFDLAYNAV